MKLLIFDVHGKYAHFRKFYTNSSSLTYSIPPRTTIIGLIAAILGYERDSYYQVFSKENCDIALKKISKNRKIMQTVNYIKADSIKLIYNPENHTQIPFEIITSEDDIIFRIYVAHKDETIINNLKERIQNKKYFYAPYLGAAPFNCSTEFIDFIHCNLEEVTEEVDVHSVVDNDYIVENSIDIFSEPKIFVREKMPCDIEGNRIVKSVKSYLFEDTGKPIKMKINSKILRAVYKENNTIKKENIVFM